MDRQHTDAQPGMTHMGPAPATGPSNISPQSAGKPARAWVLLPSGGRLNLLAPDPWAWTDIDLAIGLSRTYRWAGYSAWDLPLSVAQHSLTVLTLCKIASDTELSPAEALRELLHDAVEALLGGVDVITPLKPYLGAEFVELAARMQAALDTRYRLPAWTAESYQRHKSADRLAAASEALHVAAWSPHEIQNDLEIAEEPLTTDPLQLPKGMGPWEPWPPQTAAKLFLEELQSLISRTGSP